MNIGHQKSVSNFALSGYREANVPDDPGLKQDQTKLIAFYLPQFHRIRENDEWWGAGFTEWTNVAKARPNFKDHYQPHIPKDLGFYDLTNVQVMQEQVALAKQYGVYGFCFYYYWFSGVQVLERPLNNFLKSDIDFPFCLCWANENWTRTWDGDTKSILLEQKYQEGDEERFIDSMMPFFLDSRYIKVDEKPKLVIYRISQLPDPRSSILKWREAAQKAGLPGLHIVVVDFYGISDPRDVGADAIIEFPPHKFNGPQNYPDTAPTMTNQDFSGNVFDYVKMIAQSAYRKFPDYNLYRGIIPSWDNTARRQNASTIILNSCPELYGAWLSYLRAYSRIYHPKTEGSFLFINAWNEWGEGCHLEPDLRWGLGYLEETKRSSWYDVQENSLDKAKERLELIVDMVIKREKIVTIGEMSKYIPQSFWVSKSSFLLRRYPRIHKLSKFVYHRIYKLWH